MTDIQFDVESLYLLLNAFILLFSVLNVVGNVPIFLTLTGTLKEDRRKISTYSVIIALIILLIFAYVGLAVFQFLGITINDFKIAGGIILFIVAFQHLIGKFLGVTAPDAEEIAAFPIATPLLAGPGAISTVIIISSQPYNLLLATIVILLNCLIAWAALVRSELIYRILGSSGTKVLTRIMGLLIAAIAVSFVREGIEAVVMEMIKL
ncbi:MAG: MarC family protein [Nitrososphaerales archaeon]